MLRPKLFYVHGTSFTFRQFEDQLATLTQNVQDIVGVVLNPQGEHIAGAINYIAGLNGQTWPTNGAAVNDPFPKLVDSDVWEVIKIVYPANMLAMGDSIDEGVTAIVSQLNDMPTGTPWALGGYSQGAAVCATVLVEAQSGSLTRHYPHLLGGIMFGSPRRKQNFRGPIGGTWSGAWDVPNSNTGGGGSFPDSGPWARLTNPPDNWVEFTAPGDVFNAVGTSAVGNAWRQANGIWLDVFQSDVLGALFNLPTVTAAVITALNDIGAPENFFIDALGSPFRIGGNGHTTYPSLPPPNSNGVIPFTNVLVDGVNYRQPVGDTCYQLALKYLSTLAGEWSTVPLVVPEPVAVEPAWQTTLATPSQVLTSAWSTSL